MLSKPDITLHLGEIWHITADPFGSGGRPALEAIARGAMAVNGAGRIEAVGVAAEMAKTFPEAQIVDHGESLILPGFIDGHLHFPQLDIIGSYGEQLLGWLNRYTFPTEARFADATLAHETAQRLMTELFANGTTTGVIFSSVHASATEALFQAAADRGLRMIAGKVSMDRNAPAGVLQEAKADLKETTGLIEKWHGADDGRLQYALTPRFVPTCSEELLAGLGRLYALYPGIYLQTHWAENQAEIAWVKDLCPGDCDYLGVYERHGMLGPRTLLAHAIHVDADMLRRVADAGAIIAHCPTSNLFLGSGLYPMDQGRAAGAKLVIGTDIGGGTSVSMWRTLEETYKIQQLRGHSLTGAQLLYMATLGAAGALGMENSVGNFASGKFADFQVVDWRRNRLLAPRFDADAKQAMTPEEKLFALITLADDRVTAATYVQGREVFRQ